MNWFKRNLYNLRNPQKHGNELFFQRVDGSTSFNSMQDNQVKLETVFRSPAFLAVVKVGCDLFSLGKVGLKDDADGTSPTIDKLKQPNPFQGGRQFLWDYMFYLMTFGNSFMEAGSKVMTPENNLYWLNPANMQFDDKLLDKLDRQYFSKKEVDKLGEQTIQYTYRDGSKRNIRLDKLESFTDLTNSTGNWYAGGSALDALYKVVSNSEAALDAKNINLDFSGKFIVSGSKPEVDYESRLSAAEQKSIEDGIGGGKKITAVKSLVNIARYVDNIAQLELDKSYFSDYYIIGKMYGIPREVLEANLERGSTFSNQEISRASYVEYVLMPKGQDLIEGLKNYFSLEEDLEISWNHLLFMQSVKKNEAEVNKTRSETIKTLVEAGVTNEGINELLGIDITLNPKEDVNNI